MTSVGCQSVHLQHMKHLREQNAVHGRILLIDDDAVLLQALSDALRIRLGHVHIDTCLSPIEPLNSPWNLQQYQVIATDVRMPYVDGLTFLRTIHKQIPTIPVIVMTAYDEVSYIQEGVRAGAYAVVKKPFERDSIVRLFWQALMNSSQGNSH